MGSDQVFSKISQSLAEVLGTDEDQISPGSTLTGDLEATSLDVVDLLFQLKKNFGIELTLADVQRELLGDEAAQQAAASDEQQQGFDDALFQNVTVQDVVNWVEARLAA